MATKSQRRAGAPRSEVLAALPLACSDERAAFEFFERQRWGTCPNCPRCGDTDVRQMLDRNGARNYRFLWRCKGCKQQYTVKIGTVMEDSPIPMRHWAYAFYEACKSKKGVSAVEVSRQCSLTYKSALFMMHRIREAMQPANEAQSKLGGNGEVVEFDETFVGGKPRKRPLPPKGSQRKGKPYDFSKRKTMVLAGVERGGRVRARVIGDNEKRAALQDHVRDMVSTNAHLQTDEYVGYNKVGKEFASHQKVHHSIHEYVRHESPENIVTTNRVEGFWAGLKRQIGGTHHAVTKRHLHRYVTEAEFKYNTRHLDDGERTVLAIQSADNRRLTYKQQTGKE